MSTFGERLKELRQEKNMFATQLAKILEVESATISNWEKDIRTPKKDMLIKIADYFDCSLDYLVGRTDNKDSKVISSEYENHMVSFEIDRKYPYDLSPEDVRKMLDQLKAVGLNIDTLIENAKKK